MLHFSVFIFPRFCYWIIDNVGFVQTGVWSGNHPFFGHNWLHGYVKAGTNTNGFVNVNSFFIFVFLYVLTTHTSFSRTQKKIVQARTSLSYARRVVHRYLEAHKWLHLYDFAQYPRTHTIAHTGFLGLAHHQSTFLTTPTLSLARSLAHTIVRLFPLSLSVFQFSTPSAAFLTYTRWKQLVMRTW